MKEKLIGKGPRFRPKNGHWRACDAPSHAITDSKVVVYDAANYGD